MSAVRRRSTEAQGSGRGAGSAGGAPDGPGWRYTLRVPSWSQAQLPDGETAVFYQVEVTVLPPLGEPRKRSVGRRFSSFVMLHRRLREELGAAPLRGLDPPPRRSLAGVNRKPAMVEQRRWELEQWLWRLTESPAVANSTMMFHFCELDAAARMRPRARASPPSAGGGGSQLDSPLGSLGAGGGAGAAPFLAGAGSSAQLSPMHSYAPSWSGSEASELLGESSASSLAAAAAAATATLSAGAGSSPEGLARRQPPLQQGATPARQQAKAPASLLAPSESQSDASSSRQHSAQLPGGPAGAGQLRVALPVQQRGAAKAAARQLREQLATAQADLQDAVRTIAGDQQAIAQLAAELAQQQELQRLQEEAGLEGEGSAAAAAELAQQAAAAAALRQQLTAAEAERDALQERVQQLAAQAAEGSGQQAEQAHRLAELQEERGELERRVEEVQRQLAAAQQSQQEGLAGQAEERQQLLAVLEAQCLGLQAQLGEAAAAAAQAQADREAAAVKSREDLKVLAREVKALRKQLAAQEQAAASAAANPAEPAAALEQPQQREPPSEEQQQLQRQLEAREGDVVALREQLMAVQAAATAVAAQHAPASNGVAAKAAAAGAEASAAEPQLEALLDAATALRTLLASCGVDGGEGGLPGGDARASLAAADQQLASIRLQVQRQLLEAPAVAVAADEPPLIDIDGAGGAPAARPASRLAQLLAGLLLDAAAAKQQQHDLLRSTLAVTAQLQGLEERLLSPTASPVRRAPTL